MKYWLLLFLALPLFAKEQPPLPPAPQFFHVYRTVYVTNYVYTNMIILHMDRNPSGYVPPMLKVKKPQIRSPKAK